MQTGQPPSTDLELVRRALSGEQDAFHELVDRHAGVLYALAVNLVGSPADAEDVLQDTFTKALLRGRSLGNLRIFVHPEDAARLDPGWRDFQVTISGQRIQIVPTESVRPGGCYIEGDQGTVDARIETRLDAVLNVFENQAG